MDETTVLFYEKNAAEIASRYETVATPVERYFGAAFVEGSRILDIGAVGAVPSISGATFKARLFHPR